MAGRAAPAMTPEKYHGLYESLYRHCGSGSGSAGHELVSGMLDADACWNLAHIIRTRAEEFPRGPAVNLIDWGMDRGLALLFIGSVWKDWKERGVNLPPLFLAGIELQKKKKCFEEYKYMEDFLAAMELENAGMELEKKKKVEVEPIVKGDFENEQDSRKLMAEAGKRGGVTIHFVHNENFSAATPIERLKTLSPPHLLNAGCVHLVTLREKDSGRGRNGSARTASDPLTRIHQVDNGGGTTYNANKLKFHIYRIGPEESGADADADAETTGRCEGYYDGGESRRCPHQSRTPFPSCSSCTFRKGLRCDARGKVFARKEIAKGTVLGWSRRKGSTNRGYKRNAAANANVAETKELLLVADRQIDTGEEVHMDALSRS